MSHLSTSSRRIFSTAVLFALLTTLALLGLGSPQAVADEDGCNTSVWCPHDGNNGGGTQNGGGSPGTPGQPAYYAWEGAWIPLPGTLPTGEENGCWGARIVGGARATPPPADQTYAAAMAENADVRDNGALWGACPPATVFDLVAYVNQYWRDVVKPPPPSPLQIRPGKMLVAFTAYLEIGGDPAPRWSLANPIGPAVTIRATPRYVVSWGDGITTETSSQGVAYPGGPGEITHAYRNAGDYTVTVRAYWRGEWSAGGDGGQLPELPVPTASSLALPVAEAQSVTD